jgi:hypothetical protein
MEKIDALFEMVAKIAQETAEIKTILNTHDTKLNTLDTKLNTFQQENNARFDRIEQKLDVVVEQVAGLSEFKNEMTLKVNKLATTVAENCMDIRLLKKVASG